MSVLLFTESCEPGGSERVVEAIALFLRDKNIPVTLATLETGWLSDTIIKHGIEHELIVSNSKDVMLPSKIAKVCRKHGHKVIHSHLLDSYFYGSLTSLFYRIRHIGTEHGDVHHTEKKKFTSLKLRIAGITPSHITSVSDFTRQRLIELGLPKSSCSTLYNPVLLPKDYTNNGNQQQILDELKLPKRNDYFFWVHAASLFPVKNQTLLMDAFDRACTAEQHLLIIGDGPEYDRLAAHKETLKNPEHIHLLGFRDNIHEYYAFSDAFVLSSDSEAMPMSILEASAHKLPVVATDVGGISEILSDDQGYLSPVKDAEQLAAKMMHVYSNQKEANNKAMNSYNYVMGEFSLDNIGNKLLELYGLSG